MGSGGRLGFTYTDANTEPFANTIAHGNLNSRTDSTEPFTDAFPYWDFTARSSATKPFTDNLTRTNTATPYSSG